MSELAIGPGTEIRLHFSLALEDGQLVDSTFEAKPASFQFGDGSLLPGFEKHLLGLSAGDQGRFQVPPEDAFAQPNPANVQQFKRDQFDADAELAEGMVMAFADAQGGELPGVIKAISAEEVTVDFNHPLAGRTLEFVVEIIDVQMAAEADA